MCVAFVVVRLSIIVAPTHLCALCVLEIINILLAIVQHLLQLFFVKTIFFYATFIMCATIVIVKLYTIVTPTQLVCMF
jgi:hypothetical protein